MFMTKNGIKMKFMTKNVYDKNIFLYLIVYFVLKLMPRCPSFFKGMSVCLCSAEICVNGDYSKHNSIIKSHFEEKKFTEKRD